MRKALLGGALSIITFAAATPATAKESGLVPPAQSTGESRQEDVQTCICRQVLTSPSASLLMMMPCFYYRTIIPKDPSGRAAHREQRLCSDTERVALSDRYVVCLLKRGYKWPENSGNSPESAPANGRKRSSDPYGTPATVRIDPRWLTQLILGNPHRCQS